MTEQREANPRLISAAAMAHAMSTDVQFIPPQKPRLLQEIMMVPLTDGLLFEGAAERQVLRGKAVTVLLPRFLPLLDGNRTPDEIQAALPDLPSQAVHNALALLYTRGLVEDGAVDAPGSAAISDEMLGFLRRNIDATRMNRSAAQAAARISTARVCIIGEDRIAEATCVALRRHGFTGVNVAEDVSAAVAADPTFILAGAVGPESTQRLIALDAACAAAGVPWLHCSIYGNKGMIGPYFDRGETPCYECFAQHRIGEEPAFDELSTPQRAFWAERLAIEVTYMVCLIAAPQEHDVTEIDLESWTQRRLRMPPVPGCAECCPATDVSPGELPAAFSYEHAVSFPSRRYLVPKDHQMHYRLSNLELSKETKVHPSATGDALPSVPNRPDIPGCFLQTKQDTRVSSGPMERAHLATLLAMTAGIRQVHPDSGKFQRWAPTGGNLGSVHAHVLVGNVAGLAPGWYLYDAAQHCLSRVGHAYSAEEARVLMAQLAPDDGPSPDLLLVLSGAVGRVTHKYGLFGYRVVHLDAGVALAQAFAVCDAFGWHRRFVPWSPEDQLVEFLRLDANAEQPTAIVAIIAGGVSGC